MTTNDNVAIDANGLVKCFGDTRAVDGVDSPRAIGASGRVTSP